LIYAKPPLSFEAQADQLIQRGMGGERPAIIKRLAAVNYHRLTGYWFPFRASDGSFRPGTTFDQIWERYVFDRHLRLLLMDAIGHIEIAVRTQIAYHHSHHFGAFAYATDPRSLPGLQDREEFLARIKAEVERSQERFVAHFRTKYGSDHDDLPIWMLTEVLSFGTALTLFRGCPLAIANEVARVFSVPSKVLSSWLLCLNAVRNICAHHGRLWNRVLGVKPMIPRPYTHPDWSEPVLIPNDRIFAVLTMCRYCLDQLEMQGRWLNRLRGLLDEFPTIPRPDMGFPSGWESSPLWAEHEQGE
jgi:abortive infection bacteriophage resistance protein